jgi:hypothetical protein
VLRDEAALTIELDQRPARPRSTDERLHEGGGDTRQESGAKEHIARVGIQPVEELRREVVRDRVRRAAPLLGEGAPGL